MSVYEIRRVRETTRTLIYFRRRRSVGHKSRPKPLRFVLDSHTRARTRMRRMARTPVFVPVPSCLADETFRPSRFPYRIRARYCFAWKRYVRLYMYVCTRYNIATFLPYTICLYIIIFIYIFIYI